MTFDEMLTALIERAREIGMPQEELEAAVAEFHRQHDREPPPPITGTVAIVEPDDGFK
jgi:hypothetical protein